MSVSTVNFRVFFLGSNTKGIWNRFFITTKNQNRNHLQKQETEIKYIFKIRQQTGGEYIILRVEELIK